MAGTTVHWQNCVGWYTGTMDGWYTGRNVLADPIVGWYGWYSWYNVLAGTMVHWQDCDGWYNGTLVELCWLIQQQAGMAGIAGTTCWLVQWYNGTVETVMASTMVQWYGQNCDGQYNGTMVRSKL